MKLASYSDVMFILGDIHELCHVVIGYRDRSGLVMVMLCSY